MLKILANKTYAQLFTAQIVALLGTGLLTVALGLMAYDLAGDAAGLVLGGALTIKMVAYVVLSPVANALFGRFNRKHVLIIADLVRALVALLLPFVDAIWQIYVLIFILQTASASFTPTFQATIPDILPDEKDYTKALSLARLAYDLENIISPSMAGLLLTVVSYHWLFSGTALGFVLSMLLIIAARFPAAATAAAQKEQSFKQRLTRGIRIYLATPRLRGLLALNFVASASSAMVIVNTVVIVRGTLSGSESDVAIGFAAYGLGSMISALALPNLLENYSDRPVMMAGATATTAGLTLFGVYLLSGGGIGWTILLVTWLGFGLCYSMILTPSGRLLRRSSHSEDRPALFAAQFALSHGCWLITYPLAGWLGHAAGMGTAMLVLGLLSALALVIGLYVWPRSAGAELEHSHEDLPPDHPHLKTHQGQGTTHRHAVVIDDEHRIWPTQG
ncbi:MAG: MFS transporter [Rhizobiaceae bacterium]|nr:MFS transporter [Rhizobiaceae bacterium]